MVKENLIVQEHKNDVSNGKERNATLAMVFSIGSMVICFVLWREYVALVFATLGVCLGFTGVSSSKRKIAVSGIIIGVISIIAIGLVIWMTVTGLIPVKKVK